MKKCLLTGMAAVALCAAFTSCSKSVDLYDQGAVEANDVNQIYEAYNQAFIKTFGQPAPDQDWGFGPSAKAMTRDGESDTPVDWDVRVIAEDLNASALDAAAASSGLNESDWDFNDVVFDVKFIDETSAWVKIVCAGGVLPLYVAGHEVHQELGGTLNSNGQYDIIGMSDACTPFRVDGISRSNNGRDIKVEVKRPLSSGTEVLLELRADTGLPAAKIAVSANFTPCAEREDIRKPYPNFTKWVSKQVDSFYN